MTTPIDVAADPQVGAPPSSGTPSDLMIAPLPDAPAEVIAERLMAATLGGMEMMAVHLGGRLGWYRALAEHGPLTSGELARLTGTAERYAREWLEHQAASGYLDVHHDGVDAMARSYRIHAGAVEVFTDVDSLNHVAPMSGMFAAVGRVTDRLVEAYRSGGGVSWEELGSDARQAQAALNRPLFLHQLTQEIFPGIPELHSRLLAGTRVADIGCGEGWSAIGVAQGYRDVRVDGVDIDGASIDAATRHAWSSGVGERVSFIRQDAAELGDASGRYGVVSAFECVHDMPDPVAVLTAMRRIAAPDAFVLVMDERTGESFAAPAEPIERLLYGFSLLVCLPDGLSAEQSVGTGTVMRPGTLERYAIDAGYSAVEVLPVEHEMFRFYRLHL